MPRNVRRQSRARPKGMPTPRPIAKNFLLGLDVAVGEGVVEEEDVEE
jgi:hypothetical protein